MKVTAHTPRPTYRVLERHQSSKWEFTERLHDDDDQFVQREFHPRQVQRSPEIVEAFGSATPHSGDLLLHYAGDPPEGVEKKPYPVLLVHGANKTGEFWFDPHEDGSNDGLPQHLREQGHQVYAVTFANNQDDNFIWAEQVANAIDRIKELTGAEKIDLVGHSKGGMPSRMYTSDVRQEWGTPYGEDVRRLVLVGAPNKGIDYGFRHPAANYALYKDSDEPLLNAPMSWEGIMAWGLMRDTVDQSYSAEGKDYWPGQRQMLHRWDDEYRLPKMEPDWYTTYNGGRGFVSRSQGIDHYIEQGGNLIDRLESTPVDEDVEVALLAGDAANIPGILNEYTGPSDGLVFVNSALAMSEGTNVVARELKHLHHKDLVADEEGQQWIAEILSAEDFDRAPSLEEAARPAYARFNEEEAEEMAKATVANPTVLAAIF